MYKYLQNFSVKNIVLFAVIFFTILMFSISTIYLSTNVRENTKKDSKTIVDRYTNGYALRIEGLLNEVMSITRTLAHSFIENKDSSLNHLHPANKNILNSALKNNPDFLSVWFHWEIKLIDPNYKKKHGRVGNIMLRSSDGNFKFSRTIRDTTNQELTTAYSDIKEGEKEIVGEPYYDSVNKGLEGILMVSPVVPILANGDFLGAVGIDLDMRRIQQIVTEIKPYEESISYLISPQKIVIAHTHEKFHNKALLEINPSIKANFETAIQQISKNKAHSFIYNDENDQEVYVSIFPISIGRDKEIWALATETPISKVLQKSNSMFAITILIGIICILALSTVIYFILKSVTKRLLLAVSHSHNISQGDLTSKLEIHGKNEIAVLANSLNKMAERLKDVVSNISSSSESINSSSSEITTFSSDLSKSSSSQAASVEEVMASIEEMTSNIHRNSNNAKETEVIAEKALRGVKNGSNSANKTASSINKIAEKISIIHEISNQTNILALNAAVEAARAGKNGKGFAVVANEVKKLAEKAQVAATEINELSSDGVHISDLAEKELSLLVPDIEKTAQLVREIANANLEQSNGSNEIQRVIMELNNIAQKNAVVSDNLNLKAQHLSRESNQLKEIIKVFKI